ncbi:MAG: tryptophan synthase subunit alpha [Nitrospirae bacterium]|nr:tryptophan synthase subunit alpha [Nitrospirota bacterium]
MSEISRVLEDVARRRRKALIPFVTAGDPDAATTEALLPALQDAGADVIEIGVPFSDPVADGVVIQASSQRALRGGMTTAKTLDIVRRARRRVSCPIVLMGYTNPVLRYGVDRLARDAASAGVNGFILVDLPPEEAEPARRALRQNGIDLIFLLTPASPGERIARVAARASGFIYYVAYTGVTGARAAVHSEVGASVRRIRKRTRLPVMVGFGVRTPEQARSLAAVADGVIVGSALIRGMEGVASRGGRVRKAAAFVESLRRGLDRAA